ncbi:MAG: FAD-dependent oxidoreductase, partial [Alphaproteobacteria bacterium]|nr:FAD-dependent oxidoreductase [Alphaproteobacteria bacterium]
MADFDYDLFTIGAGSGGVAGSRRAATYGAKVAIAESVRVAGTCVLRGCVPKKLLVYGVHFADELEDAAGYGWTIGAHSFDWAKLVQAKDKEIDRLHGIYIKMLKDAGVEIIDG